jgi:hypothetical protein
LDKLITRRPLSAAPAARYAVRLDMCDRPDLFCGEHTVPTADQTQRTRRLAAPTARALFCVALLALTCTSGCSESTVPNDDDGEKLRQLTILYAQFAVTNEDTGPADEAEFKQFISQRPGEIDIEPMFMSERDGQPFVILYGKKLTNSYGSSGPPDVVIYEEVGVGGKRYLGAAGGEVGIVDEAKFKELVPD